MHYYNTYRYSQVPLYWLENHQSAYAHHLCCREEKKNARWHLPYSKGDSETTNRMKRGFSFARKEFGFLGKKKCTTCIFIGLYSVNLEYLRLLIPLSFQLDGKPRSQHANSMLNHLDPENDTISGPLDWCHKIDKSQLNFSSPLVGKLPVLSSRLGLSRKAQSVPAKDEWGTHLLGWNAFKGQESVYLWLIVQSDTFLYKVYWLQEHKSKKNKSQVQFWGHWHPAISAATAHTSQGAVRRMQVMRGKITWWKQPLGRPFSYYSPNGSLDTECLDTYCNARSLGDCNVNDPKKKTKQERKR